MSKGWDSNMLKKLKSLIGKGLSTAEMGKKLGMSKNAVVGKLNRLGWNTKAAEPESAKSKISAKSASKPVSKKTETPRSGAKKILKNIVARVSNKKSTDKKTVKTPVGEKKLAKKKEKPETKFVVEKIVVKEKPKTASKKTKKDLALHELLIQHALQMANLKPNQCRWPIGDPDSGSFHFCGETVFSGKPYCYEHCRQAYQFVAPKKK